MYTAYFDESGHSASEGFVAIAAYIADDKTWTKFDVAWNAVLAKHGVKYMHAYELSNRTKIFKGWTREQQKALSADLIDAFQNAGRIVAAGAVLRTADFYRLDESQQDQLQNPFFPLFQEVVRAASLEAMFEPAGEKVRMVFSQQDEFGPLAKQLYAVMEQVLDTKERLGGLDSMAVSS